MKTLYVSDLDGTLLRSDETLSTYTCETLNRLTAQGMLFSYATARSYNTSRKVTAGLNANFPLIVYNGVFIVDNADGGIIISNYFSEDVKATIADITAHGVYPIVYSMIDGEQKFSYVRNNYSKGTAEFAASRKGDRRDNPVSSEDELLLGRIFYVTCIDDEAKLEPLYDKYRDIHHCVFSKDIYSGEQWLEMIPKGISKATAARQLKEHLGCERIVAFGDGKNDIELFEAADESCAVENADDELRAAATHVIGSNNADGVVKWIEQDFTSSI